MTLWLRHVHVVCSVVASMPLKFRLYRHRYVITELLQSDLHKIIVSPQHLSPDHIKVFLYQILREGHFDRVLRAVRGSLHSTQFPATALEKWQPPKYEQFA
ncbi:hypothetical protein HZH68_011957 [Vespula germanica]|uniref:Uncharacterized protein n=1 Tax=Vespula germanica TaxID=30212 RepID=A0A834JLD0_VESGE|nr:hypothetical protein HZH68_011957 [Vespula germanica]